LQITYNVICPDIDPLTSAAADFFQQLGTGKWVMFFFSLKANELAVA
jgi:hypothetical protein